MFMGLVSLVFNDTVASSSPVGGSRTLHQQAPPTKTVPYPIAPAELNTIQCENLQAEIRKEKINLKKLIINRKETKHRTQMMIQKVRER